MQHTLKQLSRPDSLLSTGNADDVYLLVLAFLGTAQYRRALHVLEQRGLTTADLRFRYIAAKCHVRAQQPVLKWRPQPRDLALALRPSGQNYVCGP